jgi:transcriptional regulator with XRE-family HTH domain
MVAINTIQDGVRVLVDGENLGRVIHAYSASAFVAFDDGRPSATVMFDRLRRCRGRRKGQGLRIPLPSPSIDVERVLSAVVAAEMKRQQLTWGALAERSGVSKATIARIVAGNGVGQRIDTIEAIAIALGIEPGKFWIAGDIAKARR